MEALAVLAITRLQPENELSRHDKPQKPKRFSVPPASAAKKGDGSA